MKIIDEITSFLKSTVQILPIIWVYFAPTKIIILFLLIIIRGLDVKEKFRNKGYGRKILDLIKDYAKSKKFKYLTLNYHKSNKIAERLYKNYGFLEDFKVEGSSYVNLKLKI